MTVVLHFILQSDTSCKWQLQKSISHWRNIIKQRASVICPQKWTWVMSNTSMQLALEETSIADFICAMNSLQTQARSNSTPRPQRKNGTSGMTPPSSLHSLFAHGERRMSLRPTPTPSVHNASLHYSSLHPVSRRFSVHPSNLSVLLQPANQPLRLMAPHLFQGQQPPH